MAWSSFKKYCQSFFWTMANHLVSRKANTISYLNILKFQVIYQV